MELVEQATQLGKLVGNLLSLEFLLRYYLYERALIIPHQAFASGDSLVSAQVGTVVPHNALTSYDALLPLIRRYNEDVPNELKIDESLVELRNSIAHGRVTAPMDAEHLRIMRFSNPRRGPVRVTVSETLDPDWFRHQIERTLSELFKVARAAGVKVP